MTKAKRCQGRNSVRQPAPYSKAQVVREMKRACHPPRKMPWPKEAFTTLAARLSDAARGYAGASQVRQTKLEALYAAKLNHTRAKAAYRQAKKSYQAAYRSAQAAKVNLVELRGAYDRAFRDAYAKWCARHPKAGQDDCLRAVRELARLRGVDVTQMARLLGYRAERTPAELAEDLKRYLDGTPMHEIARERGISRQAVYDHIRQSEVAAIHSAALVRERSHNGRLVL